MIICVSDVVYDNSIIPALVFVLKSLLSSEPLDGVIPQAFIASTVRNEDTRDEFLIAIGKSQPDPPENCHLTVKKLTKTSTF